MGYLMGAWIGGFVLTMIIPAVILKNTDIKPNRGHLRITACLVALVFSYGVFTSPAVTGLGNMVALLATVVWSVMQQVKTRNSQPLRDI